MKPDKTAEKSDYETMLEGLENTMVYKLDELRSYKISPIRNKKKVEVVDDTAIKNVLENTVQLKRDLIESELSKTQYLKDLKERVAEAERELEEPKVKKEVAKAKEESKKETKVETPKKEEKPKEEKKETKKVEKEVKKPAVKQVKKLPNTHATRRTRTYKKKS